MITIFIKPNQFFKNVNSNGDVFEIKNEAIYLDNSFTKIELDEAYKDCDYLDFNEDLTFSVDKYNARKQKESADTRIAEIKPRLEQLSQDLIQAQAGAVFGTRIDEAGNIIDILEEKIKEFQTLHNELRVLLGKEPREYAEE